MKADIDGREEGEKGGKKILKEGRKGGKKMLKEGRQESTGTHHIYQDAREKGRRRELWGD
jgi:hypothetical protein